jgi:hypothetical protein
MFDSALNCGWYAPTLIRRPESSHSLEEKLMSLGTILLIVLILLLVGAIPTWPHSKSWGYGPSGAVGLVVVVLLVLLVMGRL